jgi:hypothetical protein
MAQQDAMEQVKEVVRQLIKYRFWIAISAAALFGLIAYFMGAGPVQDAAKKETAVIQAAEKDVKQYTAPTIPTKEYKPLVQEKTGILTKDVNAAWKTLYDRQAPLLTWPETVQARFRKWGRDWPKDENAGSVTIAQIDYIAAYKDYVDMVYKTFKPFDYETGEGIVVAPPLEALLRPAVFSDEHPPGLSKIWSAQERLWIQRTLLEVVAEVNKNAKDWNGAIIRQIELIEVGNPSAQDQHSLAKNEELEEAKKILAPGETEEAVESPASASPMAGMMNRMGGRMMGSGMAAGNQNSESVYYVKSGNDEQFKILPVQMTVLIDQDHVQDLLVELENSPMSIEVKDFELQRPTTRVVKPEKGTTPEGGFGGGMMGGMMSSMMRGRGMTGYGGMMGQMQTQMRMQSQMGAMMMGRMGGGMMGGMMGAPGAAVGAARKGTDNRGVDRSKKRKEEETKINEAKGPSLFDPYFDIVEVTVYGQARFFRPPPAEAAAEPSPGATPAAEATAPAPAAAAAAASPDAKGTPSPDAKGAAPSTSAPLSPGPAAQEKPASQAQAGAASKKETDASEPGTSSAPPGGGSAPKAGDAAAKPEGGPAKPVGPAGASPAGPAASKGASPKP